MCGVICDDLNALRLLRGVVMPDATGHARREAVFRPIRRMIELVDVDESNNLLGGKACRLLAQLQHPQFACGCCRLFIHLLQTCFNVLIARRNIQIAFVKYAGFVCIPLLIRHIRPGFIGFGDLRDPLAGMGVVRFLLQCLHIQVKGVFARRRGELLPDKIVVRLRKQCVNLPGRDKRHAVFRDPARRPFHIDAIPAVPFFQNLVAFVFSQHVENVIRAPRPGTQIQRVACDDKRFGVGLRAARHQKYEKQRSAAISEKRQRVIHGCCHAEIELFQWATR